MRTIKCKGCGKIFEATRYICYCDECRNAAEAENRYKMKECKLCGTLFSGGPAALYCPECRIVKQRERELESKKRKKEGKTRQLGSTDLCVSCGKPYTVVGPIQKYCPDCAERIVQEQRRELALQHARDNKDKMFQRKKELAETRKVCKVCGTPFYAPTATNTCSDECKKALQKYNQAVADLKRGKRKTLPDLQHFKNR